MEVMGLTQSLVVGSCTIVMENNGIGDHWGRAATRGTDFIIVSPPRHGEPFRQVCRRLNAFVHPPRRCSCLDAGVSMCRNDDPPRARSLAETTGGASNVLVGTPRDILWWCTVTYPLVREGGAPQRRWVLPPSLISLFNQFLIK